MLQIAALTKATPAAVNEIGRIKGSIASRQTLCHVFHGYYLDVLTPSFEAEGKSCFIILRRVMKLEAGFATYSLGELSPVSGVQPMLDSVPSGFVENIRLSFTPQRRHRRFS
jgi:hypothetical protein